LAGKLKIKHKNQQKKEKTMKTTKNSRKKHTNRSIEEEQDEKFETKVTHTAARYVNATAVQEHLKQLNIQKLTEILQSPEETLKEILLHLIELKHMIIADIQLSVIAEMAEYDEKYLDIIQKMEEEKKKEENNEDINEEAIFTHSNIDNSQPS